MGLKNDYDGNSKSYTADCPGCELNLKHPINDRDACYWGVAWKYLIKTDKPRKCALKIEESPRKRAYNELAQSLPSLG